MNKKTIDRLLFIGILCLLFSGIVFSGCLKRNKDNPNTKVRYMVFDDLNRSYRIHIPPDTDQYTALLLVLHGGGGTAEHTEEELTKQRFNTLSDQYGFIVVYPNGIEKRWNDGRNENNPVTDVDDVGFLSQLIDTMISEFDINPKHVFCTGISNGGQMSYRLACEQSTKITAIAPVVSALHEQLYNNCSPGKPVSVFLIAGQNDPLVPYDGGKITLFNNSYGTVVSMNQTVYFWVNHNNCSKIPIVSTLPDTDPSDGCLVKTYEYLNADDQSTVLFYSIEGGGHTWPDGGKYLFESVVGKICYDFNACDHIWNFFNQTKIRN